MRSPLGHGARRLACKTTFYGALHVCVAAAMAYAVSGDLSQALGIETIEPLVQTEVFALHYRLWERSSPAPADDLQGRRVPLIHDRDIDGIARQEPQPDRESTYHRTRGRQARCPGATARCPAPPR